jgi:hypothetical protein
MNMRGRMLAAIAIAAVAVVGIGQAAGASVTRDVRPVFALPAFTPVAGAQSRLIRLDDAIAFALHTSGLTPEVPATVLLVVFNNPKGCSHGVGGLHCGEADVVPGGPAQPSVVAVTERTPGRRGRLAVRGRLSTDDPDDAVFGPGLTNPSGADIHLVIRQNGAVVQASIHEA